MFNTSAEGASTKLKVFCMGTAYDVIIFKFHGGGQSPPPLLTRMGPIIAIDRRDTVDYLHVATASAGILVTNSDGNNLGHEANSLIFSEMGGGGAS